MSLPCALQGPYLKSFRRWESFPAHAEATLEPGNFRANTSEGNSGNNHQSVELKRKKLALLKVQTWVSKPRENVFFCYRVNFRC